MIVTTTNSTDREMAAQVLTREGLRICGKLLQLFNSSDPDTIAVIDAQSSLEFLAERLADQHARECS